MNRAFEEFVIQHQNMVFSVARRILGNDADAQDIAQEAFIKAFGRFQELQHSPTASGWIRKVATNLALNHITRYRSRWVFFGQDGVHQEHDGDGMVEPSAPNPQSGGLEDAERLEILNSALNQLPDSQRVPLVLFHFEEMPYEEIATALGVSLSKVKTDIFRAREALRGKLAKAVEGKLDRRGDSTGASKARRSRADDESPPAQSKMESAWAELVEGFGCALTR